MDVTEVSAEQEIDDLKMQLDALRNQYTQKVSSLEQKIRYYQNIIDKCPAVVYTCQASGDFGAIFVGSNIKAVTGYEREQFMENASFWIDRIHPDDCKVVCKQVEKLFECEYCECEYRFLHANGHYIWLSDRVNLVRDANGEPLEMVGYLIDVTERVIAEKELMEYQTELENRVMVRTEKLNRINKTLEKEIIERRAIGKALMDSEQRYRILATHSPVGIFHIDANEQCFYVNERISQICGISANEAMGLGWQKGLHPEDFASMYEAWNDAKAHQKLFKEEYRFIRPDGSIVWVVGSIAHQKDEAGNIVGYIGTLTDITKLRQAGEQLRQHQVKLAGAEQRNAVGEMASTIAHEINQPLAAIANYAGASLLRLKAKKTSPQVLGMIEKIASLSERLGEMVRRLKILFSKGEMQKEATHVSDIVDTVINFVEKEIQLGQIEIQVNKAEGLPIIYVDRINIEQVLLNILRNAIEAMEDAKTINKKITLSIVRHDDDQIKFIIVDTGPGISKNVLNNIFEPFVTTKQKGMGVGLALAKSIVTAHNGSLFSENLASGCQFTIIFPIQEKN